MGAAAASWEVRWRLLQHPVLPHRALAVDRSQGGSSPYEAARPPSWPCAAAQLPALADMQKGASFSYTTIKSCSFPNPHYMPHANKVTMPVSGAPVLVWEGWASERQPHLPPSAASHPATVRQ